MRKIYIQFLFLVLAVRSFAEEDFVTCIIDGQLGNQMFQIATTYALALDHNCKAYIPYVSHDNAHVNREHVFFRCMYINSSPSKIYDDRADFHHYKPIPYEPGLCIRGWFASERYFVHRREEILALFAPSDTVAAYIQNKYSSVLAGGKTVGIHVRTYIPDGRNPSLYGFWARPNSEDPKYTWQYFLDAMDFFPSDSVFLVFSDNISWTKMNFPKTNKKVIFIENNPYFVDFHLLAKCESQIISQSTFSWWAAWLNTNPNKKVITPHWWSDEDQICKGWILLETR